MGCDMCGKEKRLFNTDVEGSVLNLCSACSKFGKVISVVKVERKEVKKNIRIERPQKKEDEVILAIVQGYGEIIKKKREKLGLNQEDFAKKINEKKALIHKIEISQFEPPMGLARKIEKFLRIKLIEQQELKHGDVDKTKSESLTIGDFIKRRK